MHAETEMGSGEWLEGGEKQVWIVHQEGPVFVDWRQDTQEV